MSRRLLCFILIFTIITITLPSQIFADKQEIMLTEEQLQEIDEKKQQTEELKNNWDKIEVSQYDPREIELSENIDVSLETNSVGYDSIGDYGDILVTLDSASSSSSAWAGGHAGLVENTNYVFESFGNKGDLNGVRRWPNDWKTRYRSVTGLRVNGASNSDYQNAVAEAKKHLGKPYNYDFFNITTTTKFYCSQLVWRAWKNQGFDLNDGGAVWPVDLIQSSKTYTFYVQ